MFDVDDTLLAHTDAVMLPKALEFRSKLFEKYMNNPNWPNCHLFSVLLLESGKQVVDPELVTILQDLKERNVKTIGFTGFGTSSCGKIQSLLQWRLDELNDHNLDLSFSFPKTAMSTPRFHGGVLFSEGRAKGDVMLQFFQKLNWTPNTILFLDDRMENLTSLENSLSGKGIQFYGYFYTAAKDLPGELDKEVGEMQFKHLTTQGEWLGDEKFYSD